MVEGPKVAEPILEILQALMQSMAEAVGLERIQPRRGLGAVLCTAQVEAGLASPQVLPPMAAMVAPGEVTLLVLAVLAGSMMALAVLLEHPENLVAAMAEGAAEVSHLLGWDSAVMVECQEEEAVEVGEP